MTKARYMRCAWTTSGWAGPKLPRGSGRRSWATTPRTSRMAPTIRWRRLVGTTSSIISKNSALEAATIFVYRPKPSGNTQHEPAPTLLFPSARPFPLTRSTMTAIFPIVMHQRGFIAKNPRRLLPSRLMLSVCMTCMAISMNGAKTGTKRTITLTVRAAIQRGLRQARAALFGAGVGISTPVPADRPIATGSGWTTTTTALVLDWSCPQGGNRGTQSLKFYLFTGK